VAHASLTAAPIGDDHDILTSFERPAEPILEVGVRAADDQEHPPRAVCRAPPHGEDAHHECRKELRRGGGQRVWRVDSDLQSWRTIWKISSSKRFSAASMIVRRGLRSTGERYATTPASLARRTSSAPG